MLIGFYISVIIFCISHSFFASSGVKKKIYNYIPQRWYRLLYNIKSLALMMIIAAFYFSLDHTVLFRFKWQYVLGWGVVAAGTVLGYISFRSYNTMEFLGLSEENTNQHLSLTGMNRYVRHPLYFSTLIILWGVLLLEPTVNYGGFAAIMTLYLIVGAKLEEKKLLTIFGQEYRNYQKHVPMLIPFFRL